MTANYSIPLTLAIFVITLFLVLARPKGLHEAWATVIGASLMLLFQLVSISQALQEVRAGSNVMFFLFALLLLSALIDKAGFFEWAAIHSAKIAKGSTRSLFRNVFILGGLITSLLSLDTTAVILTPIVVSFVQKLKLKAHPFLVSCAFVSNTGSLLLPVSNLTNLLFQGAFHFSFARFTLTMLLPQIAVLLINYLVFTWIFRADLPAEFDTTNLPEPSSAIRDRVFFNCSIITLILVLIGYFIGSLMHIEPFVIAFGGVFLMLGVGLARKRLDKSISKEIAWSLFPFVAGLFVVIRGIENLGLNDFAANLMQNMGKEPIAHTFSLTAGTAFGSNIINNIPMALLAISILRKAQASSLDQYAALLGCNLGPNITVAGSLATMLVISSARKKGENVGAAEFFKIGIIVTPLLILSAVLTLLLSFDFVNKMLFHDFLQPI